MPAAMTVVVVVLAIFSAPFVASCMVARAWPRVWRLRTARRMWNERVELSRLGANPSAMIDAWERDVGGFCFYMTKRGDVDEIFRAYREFRADEFDREWPDEPRNIWRESL